MGKHGGTLSWRDKQVTLAAISPHGSARGCFVGGHQSGLAGSKPPPLYKRGASSCSSQRQRQRDPWGASPRPSAPTYLPTWCFPPLGLLMTIRFRVVPESCTPRRTRLPILGPLTFTSIFAHGLIFFHLAMILIVAALAIPIAVMVLNVRLVFGIKLQLHAHVSGLLSPGSCELGSSASSASLHVPTPHS